MKRLIWIFLLPFMFIGNNNGQICVSSFDLKNTINIGDIMLATEVYNSMEQACFNKVLFIDYKFENDTSLMTIVGEISPEYIFITEKIPEYYCVINEELVLINTRGNSLSLDTLFLNSMINEQNRMGYPNIKVDWNRKIYTSNLPNVSEYGLYSPKIIRCKVFCENLKECTIVNKELFADEIKYYFKFVDKEFFDKY